MQKKTKNFIMSFVFVFLLSGIHSIVESSIVNAAISETEEFKSKLIQTNEESLFIYDQPDFNYNTGKSFSRQTVYTVRKGTDGGKYDGWFKVKTSLGEKWIKPNPYVIGEFKLTLNDRETLYDARNGNPNGGSLSPQTVTAVQRIGDWFEIKTYLGNRWIKPSDFEFEKFNLTLMENCTCALFDNKNGSPLGIEIPLETVTAVKRIGDWFEIETPNGNRWIKPGDYEIGNFDLTMNKKTTLYDAKNGNPNGGSLSPQTVRAVQRDGDWFEIETPNGNRWISRDNCQCYIGDFNITINERATLYDAKSGNPNGGSLSPQTVRGVQRDGDWFEIKTYLGNRWINKKDCECIVGDFNLTTNENVLLYDKINGNPQSGLMNPQTFDAIKRIGDWYEVNTSYGNRWINTDNCQIGQFKLTLHERVSLYDAKNGNLTGATLSPQTVNVIKRSGDWFEIQTYQGNKWINPKDYDIGAFEITLKSQESLYDAKNGNMYEGKIEPQSVRVEQRSVNWYEIQTSEGNRWIETKDIVKGNFGLVLKGQEPIYDEIDGQYKNSNVEEEVVTAIKRVGDWFEIETDNGPSWIKPNEYIVISDPTPRKINFEDFFVGNGVQIYNLESIYEWRNGTKTNSSLQPASYKLHYSVLDNEGQRWFWIYQDPDVNAGGSQEKVWIKVEDDDYKLL